jgi:hypothetical protein
VIDEADDFRAIADECRAIPAEFGLREHSVDIVVTTWSGERVGEGSSTRVDYPILVGGANPKVRFPSQKEIAIGLMSDGEVRIGPFTPSYGSGGVVRQRFGGIFGGAALGPNQTWHYRVTGPTCPNGILYRQRNTNTDRALQIVAIGSPVGEESE